MNWSQVVGWFLAFVFVATLVGLLVWSLTKPSEQPKTEPDPLSNQPKPISDPIVGFTLTQPVIPGDWDGNVLKPGKSHALHIMSFTAYDDKGVQLMLKCNTPCTSSIGTRKPEGPISNPPIMSHTQDTPTAKEDNWLSYLLVNPITDFGRVEIKNRTGYERRLTNAIFTINYQSGKVVKHVLKAANRYVITLDGVTF